MEKHTGEELETGVMSHIKLRGSSGNGNYLKFSLSLTNIYLLLATPPQSSLKILGCERMGK